MVEEFPAALFTKTDSRSCAQMAKVLPLSSKNLGKWKINVRSLTNDFTADEFVAGWYLVCFVSMSVSASAALPSAGATSSQVIHCTEELSRTLHALRPNKKRKKNPKLNSYLRTSKPSGIQHRQHTQYQVHGDGSISYTRSYLEPPKNAQATTQPKSTTSALIPDQFDNTVESWDVDTVPFDDEDVRIGRAPGVSFRFGSCVLIAQSV